MEMIFEAARTLCAPAPLLAIFLGTVGGVIIGAIPGLTATMAVALLIPVTFGMDPVVGLSLMGGVYSGGMFGGAISSILLSTPGTPAAAATAFDGYPMTRKGQGGIAITVATVASFWGGIISTIALLLVAPVLAKFSLRFGPPENFLLAVMGLTSIVTLTSGNLLKGLISGVIGLLIASIGADPMDAYPRFAGNCPELYDGIKDIPALIGLFSISQLLELTGETSIVQELGADLSTLKSKKLPSGLAPTIGRGGVIGTIVGMLPGAGATISAFISYNMAKSLDKDPESFGKGNPKGVAASESANNGCVGGSLVPMLTLGIPGNSVAACLMGGLTINNLIPGPELFSKYGTITYGFILSLFLANIVFLFLGIYLAPFFARISTAPNSLLIPAIAVLSVMGSFAIRNMMFDVWTMLGFGFLGYFLHRMGFDLGAVVLGLILGHITEEGFGGALAISNGSYSIFFTRPLCIALWICIFLLLLPVLIRKKKRAA
ncbi:MAG: tripartite tricarboxylate transporter permease [Pyramidobacter sp.]|jgi:putative tricarboxylic transport membrane protein